MDFVSTRNRSNRVSPSEAIIKGISEDGGLFVPLSIPLVDKKLKLWKNLSYNELTVEILVMYFDEFSKETLKNIVDKAYDDKFALAEKVNIKSFDRFNFLELYHGPSAAFKDMALCLLPHLMNEASNINKDNREKIILTATSGDTGKAALEGFRNIKPYKVIVFYPQDNVSLVQKQQMISENGKNAFVVGIKGNFDHAQKGVKEIFADKELKEKLAQKNMVFTSANSINIGRLVPQIVYYFYGYFRMVDRKSVEFGEKIDISVPTGNFGNLLAAYIAKQMGLPIDRLICASNCNNVLTDFINHGTYDKNRKFHQTLSPSMDILVSSNLERYLYLISKGEDKTVKNLMESLEKTGKYSLSDELKKEIKDLKASYHHDNEVLKAIKEVYKKYDYLMDTHTAIGYLSAKENSDKAVLIASTASCYKFTSAVSKALNIPKQEDEFGQMETLAEFTKKEIPLCLKDLKNTKINQNMSIDHSQMKAIVQKILEV